MNKTVWINAGEVSGDLQAAALLSALREADPQIRAIGMGGKQLALAGQENLFRVEELSVMGIAEAIGSLPYILRLLRRIRRSLEENRPDAVLLVDAPEFNFRIARMAYRLGIPVYYFIPPKVWAWRTGRVEFLKKYVRRIFSILPFEENFYKKHGINVEYVGNPLVDLVDFEHLSAIAPVPGRIGLMPGSRRKEIQSLMPVFCEASARVLRRFPEAEFHCIRSGNFTEEELRSLWRNDVPLVMEENSDRYRFMRTCSFILAASGTATLETGLAGVPTIVAYKVSPLTACIARRVLKIRWASLSNLILDREIFPEHLQEKATPELLAMRMEEWLSEPARLSSITEGLEELRRRCGAKGSAQRAAGAFLKELASI